MANKSEKTKTKPKRTNGDYVLKILLYLRCKMMGD